MLEDLRLYAIDCKILVVFSTCKWDGRLLESGYLLDINGPLHKKTCLRGLRTTKLQISQHIPAVLSAPLLFACLKVSYGPRREKTCLWWCANNKGADQPVHPGSVISTFVIRLLESIKWGSTRENLSSVVCEQQRRRSAWASAQYDQHLLYSLIGKYYIKTLYKGNFTILASLCS